MQSLKHIYIVPLLLLSFSIATAQDIENEQTTVTVEKNAEFVIYFTGENDVPKTVSVKGVYLSSKRKYTVIIGNDTIETHAPLKVEYIRAKLNEIAKEKWNKSSGLQLSSMNEVFNWIYDLKNEKDETPESGRLFLRKSIIVTYDYFGNELDYLKRTNKITKYEEKVGTATSNLSLKEANLKRYIDTISMTLKDSLAPSLKEDDSVNRKKINELQQSVSNYKNLSDTIFYIQLNELNKITYDNPIFDTGIFNKQINQMKINAIKYDTAKKEYISAHKSTEAKNIHKIKNVCLQFERGFLENIQVVVDIEGIEYLFENIYAIGFSSRNNFKNLSTHYLFARNLKNNGEIARINLADVIHNYQNLLDNYTRDYSPADTAFCVSPEKKTEVILHKDKLVNLFDSKVYSDIVGANEDAPNGLVQAEISKRLNLRTNRNPINGALSNYGFLNYMNFWGALTKVENKERFLYLSNDYNVQNNTIITPYYASTLDLIRYENLSLGMDVNAFLLDLPNTKITWYLDLGGRFGRTPIKYMNRDIDSVNSTVKDVKIGDTVLGIPGYTFTIFPKLSVEIFPERRVGLSMSYQLNHTWLLSNNQFKQVASYAKSPTSSPLIDRHARLSHMIEILLRIETSQKERSRIFARARFYMQSGDVNTFFPQLQIGYSFDLFFRK